MRVALAAVVAYTLAVGAQTGQGLDEEYTKLIKEICRIRASRPSSWITCRRRTRCRRRSKFLGRAVGTPGELTYAKDIHRYYEALGEGGAARAKFWKIGTTEEGRDIVAARDRRRGDDQVARQVSRHARRADRSAQDHRRAARSSCCTRPSRSTTSISGMHSPETGGPEMLIELAYRLIVEETPFIQNIRNNVITLITPVIEVDGREKQVDTYYFNKKRAPGDARLPLMYWGKYVQHDNNRDGMGQFLEADAGGDAADARVASDGHPRPARSADLPLLVDRHRPLQRRASIRSSSANGGRSRRTT